MKHIEETVIEQGNRPFTVDREEYPFEDHWMPYRDGRIHYIDEGEGPPVLLLHGNPTWSYLYRNVIKELRQEYRLVSLDYPGFGMSKAPTGYRFTPQEHSEVVAELIQYLHLDSFVLVVQDWGGPIGINYAVQNRDKLRGLVVMNTWAWPTTLLPMKIFSMAMGGWPLGYWLQTRQNFFANVLVPYGIHHKEKITKSLRKAYTDPFPTPESRKPTWVFPRQIRKAKPWFLKLESKLSALADVPAQILWGMKDSDGFPIEQMHKWQNYLPLNETEILDDASHYVQEDRPDRVAASIRRVIERTS